MPKNDAAAAMVRELDEVDAKALKLADELLKCNHKLNRGGRPQRLVDKLHTYKSAPEEVEEASEKALTTNKATGLNEAGWIRAVNLETGGKYSEAQLRAYLKTLIYDESVIEEKATGGKAKEKKLTLPA